MRVMRNKNELDAKEEHYYYISGSFISSNFSCGGRTWNEEWWQTE